MKKEQYVNFVHQKKEYFHLMQIQLLVKNANRLLTGNVIASQEVVVDNVVK